jgi:hypothetical protein
MGRVRFTIGEVDAALARTWLDNSRGIVEGARRHRLEVSVTLEDPLLDLCDAYLSLWRSEAEDVTTFTWDAEVDADHVRQLAEQWLLLAQLTDDDLRVIGCHWAPDETRPFYDALLAGCVGALDGDPSTRPTAQLLATEPPGTRATTPDESGTT